LLIMYSGDVEIISSTRITNSFLSTLDSSIPRNAIKSISIDISYEKSWSEKKVLSLIRILRFRQVEIKSLAVRCDKWQTGIV
jgi:hypothetical protein